MNYQYPDTAAKLRQAEDIVNAFAFVWRVGEHAVAKLARLARTSADIIIRRLRG